MLPTVKFSSPMISVQYSTTVYRNKRDGSAWRQDTAGIGRLTVADIALDDRDALHAATNKGVWKFNPTAGNWTRLGATADTLSIASIFSTRNGRIFTGTANRSTWVSADRGATWSRDSAGIGVAAIARLAMMSGILFMRRPVVDLVVVVVEIILSSIAER